MSARPVFAMQVMLYKFVAFTVKMIGKFVPQPSPLFYCGENSTRQLAAFIASSDVKKVLVVTDEIIHQLNLAQGLRNVLLESGVAIDVFSKVLPDPDERTVIEGLAAFKQANCDAVIGFGGGSVLDAAKLIAAMVNDTRPLKKVVGMLKLKHRGAPLYLVPTTAGTGSEVTMIAVLSDSTSGEKTPVVDPKLLPIAVALDPVTMLGMPEAVTAMTGIDALTHAIEAYISRNANPESDRFALMAIKLIFENLPKAYRVGADLAAREAMAMASCYAGLAFTKISLGYVHGISHQLGGFYHVPHGVANAIVLPHVLDYSEQAARPRLKTLALVTDIATEGKSDEALSKAFIDSVRSLNKDLQLPTTVASLDRVDIPLIAKKALKESHYLYAVPAYMDHSQCCQLLARLLPVRNDVA